MSRSRLALGLAVIDYGLIHWFHGDNARIHASYSTPEDKVNSPLSDLGYKVSESGEGEEKVSRVEGRTAGGLVYEMTSSWDESQGACKVGDVAHIAELRGVSVDDLLAQCHAEREAQILTWEGHELTKEMAVVARQKWFPNGKPLDIVAIGNECFRRSLAIMGAIYRRSLPPTRLPLTYNVYCSVKEWEDETARITDHLLENTRKDAGRVKLSTLDFLNTAAMLHRSSAVKFKEKTLMDAGVKRGTAQKLHSYVVLGNKYREAKLVERAFKPAPVGGIVEYSKDCHIPIESINAQQPRNLLNGKHWNDKDVPVKGGVKVSTIHKWLEDVITGKGDDVPVAMKTAEIKKIVHSPVDIVRYVTHAILTSNEEMLKVLDDMAEEINAATAGMVPEYEATADSEAEAEAEAIA